MGNKLFWIKALRFPGYLSLWLAYFIIASSLNGEELYLPTSSLKLLKIMFQEERSMRS